MLRQKLLCLENTDFSVFFIKLDKKHLCVR